MIRWLNRILRCVGFILVIAYFDEDGTQRLSWWVERRSGWEKRVTIGDYGWWERTE